MRPVVLAVGLVLVLIAGRSEAEPRIIDVRPQRKKAVVARIPEVRVAMGDSETSRNLAPSLLAQLRSLGYEVAPAVDFEVGEKPKPTRTLLRFELLRSGGSCFVSAKATEPKAETSFWRWETGDDLRPCSTQLEEAVVSFARARPPARPKAPEQTPAVDPDAPPAADPVVVDLVAAAAAAGPAFDESAREAGAEAHSRSEGGPAADAGSGPVTRDEGESAGASADGEPPADEQGAPSEPSGGKTCGCATTASALPMGALLLAGLGLGIRRRAR